MGMNSPQIELAQHSVSTARDHLSYLATRELREYPEVQDIMTLAKEVFEFLKSDRANQELKTYALDFAFSYHYERMEETSSASPKMSDIIATANEVVEGLSSF